MLVLTARDVEALLDTQELVDALAAAMVDLSEGRASMPPRVAAVVPERDGKLAAMPAFLPAQQALTTKLVSLFPQNRDRPTHQAVICCFDPSNGSPLALMDGTYITATRTAAGSELATRYLAREDARVLAIIGTGVQARTHGMLLGRRPGVDDVLVAGRALGDATALASELVAHDVPARAVGNIEDAVRDADIVCACTHADTPVVRRAWLRPGAHVNSVGYNTDGQGEVDTDLVRDATVVVESRASALAPPPAGAVELREPGFALAEIGEIVAGRAPGRVDAEQLTLYKSVGVAVQDAAAAALVLAVATRSGRGTQVDL